MRWLREPLVHFFIVGALLFAASIWLAPPLPPENDRRIVVTAETRDFLRARFQRVWRREPSATEQQQAVDEWVREEILYREGMALNLADDDAIVRRRIGQKMMMLAEAMATPVPDEAALRAWYEQRLENYAAPAVYSFEQIFYGGDTAAARAREALSALGSGEAPAGGDITLLPPRLDAAPASYVAANFGEQFQAALDPLPVGTWSGPVTSTFGAHLVLLRERRDGGPQAFEAVREDVERDWVYENSNLTRERFYEALRAEYVIVDAAASQ